MENSRPPAPQERMPPTTRASLARPCDRPPRSALLVRSGRLVIEAHEVTVRLDGDIDALRVVEIASALSGHRWLTSTLKIAGDHSQSRIRELLPWNFDPASR